MDLKLEVKKLESRETKQDMNCTAMCEWCANCPMMGGDGC